MECGISFLLEKGCRVFVVYISAKRIIKKMHKLLCLIV